MKQDPPALRVPRVGVSLRVLGMKDKSEFLYCVFIVAAAILSAVARCSFTRPDQFGRDSYD